MSDADHCRHCGRSLAPAAQFCEGCGVAVPVGGVPANPGLTTGPRGVDTPTMSMSTTGYGPLGELGPTDPTDPGDPYDWQPRRRALPWIAAVVAIALIVAAVVVVAGSRDKHSSVSSKARRSGPITMPWVVTFTVAQAEDLLAKQGIAAQQIQVVRVPRIDVSPGTVIQQLPRAGMTIEEGVILTAARVPDTMPDFVGKGVNTVRATLSTLDVKMTVDDTLDASVSDGTVLAQVPAAGAPFAAVVRLTVARRPIPTNLADLTGVGAAPTKGDATIAGVMYPDSVAWRVAVCPGARPVTVSYLLAGHYRKLLATAGLNADSLDPADQVHLDITVDGVVALRGNLDRWQPVPVDLDLTSHQQLALTFTQIGGGDPKCAPAEATLGRARLLSIAQSR